jgi:signal transduction histidine kinase
MRVLRWVSPFGRVAVALALLAALWFGTSTAIDDASKKAAGPRVQDRRFLAQALAQPLTGWLKGQEGAAAALAVSLDGATTGPRVQVALDQFAGPATTGRAALVLDRRLVVTVASTSLASKNPVLRLLGSCGGTDSAQAMMRSVRVGATPVVSGIVDAPVTCHRAVVTVAPVGAGGILVTAVPLTETAGGTVPPVPLSSDLRLLAVDPNLLVLGKEGSEVPASSGQESVLTGDTGKREKHLRTEPFATRYDEAGQSVVAAYAPAAFGWGVLVEQDGALFDLDAPSEATPIAAILAGLFAAVFALVAWFDRRRRKAARLAEVERNKFLAIVGHELRTPLTVIKGYTETLASRWDRLDDERRQMLIENLAPQTQRQARVIEHLLTAAALQAGTFTRPSIEPTDVGPVLERTAAEYQPVAPLHDIVVGGSAAVPPVSGNADALGQVLSELVDNAVRFSPSGGTVRISASAERRTVEISVEDDGVGLPSDTARLFLPFGQAEDVDNRLHAEGGIGVGLFIARSLVEMMGGQLRAERRQPDGARFVVSLPIARQNAVTGART